MEDDVFFHCCVCGSEVSLSLSGGGGSEFDHEGHWISGTCARVRVLCYTVWMCAEIGSRLYLMTRNLCVCVCVAAQVCLGSNSIDIESKP